MEVIRYRQFKNALKKAREKILSYEEWLIFFACLVVYSLNERTISSGDTTPNTLIAFNWLFNHTLHFDNFRGGHLFSSDKPYFFIEALNGHLTSTYPIGAAIVTFPIYFCFYLYLLLSNSFHSIDITSLNFDPQRLDFEKTASTIVAATSSVFFYLATRLKFDKSIALVSTFIYAFATETWIISSQGLWQHGSSNLVLLGILLCLLKANRVEGKDRKLLLLISGILCGLLLDIRPTNLVFTIAIITYVVYVHAGESKFLLFGLSSGLVSVVWNIYYFGNLFGGYSVIQVDSYSLQTSLYSFTFKQFTEGFLGILISPSRGLFVFSPIVLCAIPGACRVYRLRFSKDETLIIGLMASCLLLFLQYCFYRFWWGGSCYGPRFMTEVLPTVCFLINFTITAELVTKLHKKLVSRSTVVFTVATLYSIFVQLVGAFGMASWDEIPMNINTLYLQFNNSQRLWSFQDNPIERSARGIFLSFLSPVQDSSYVEGLRGKILQIQDAKDQVIASSILVKPESKMLLTAIVKNIGESEWLGYETGLNAGPVMVAVQILNDKNQIVKKTGLHLSGKLGRNQTGRALGLVSFPKEGGTYNIAFNLISRRTKIIPGAEKRSLHTVKIKVEDF